MCSKSGGVPNASQKPSTSCMVTALVQSCEDGAFSSRYCTRAWSGGCLVCWGSETQASSPIVSCHDMKFIL